MENEQSQYQAFSMNPEDYVLGSTIGFGSSAIVHTALYKPLDKTVAIKMIELDRFERNQIDELRKEIQVMALCKHSNLLPILATFVNESKLWIVTPFLSCGSCLDIMRTYYHNGIEEAAISTILYQALQGIDYLHKNGHIHRDVKAGNLLIDRDGLVQLADFGVTASLLEDGERKGNRKTFVGTPCWMAPEVMEMTKGYNTKADIWSFGITALELAYGSAPFARYPPMKVIYLTLSNHPPTLDRSKTYHKYSKSLKDMIDACLQRDPSKRPTAEQLLKHSFFKHVKKRSYLVSSLLHPVADAQERSHSANPASDQHSPHEDSAHTCQSWNFSVEQDEMEFVANDNAPNNSDFCSCVVSEDERANTNTNQSILAYDETSFMSSEDWSSNAQMQSNVTAAEDAVEVRKGRFSLIEGIPQHHNTTMDSNASSVPGPSSTEASPPPQSGDRKGRFEISTREEQQSSNAEITESSKKQSRFVKENALDDSTTTLVSLFTSSLDLNESQQSKLLDLMQNDRQHIASIIGSESPNSDVLRTLVS